MDIDKDSTITGNEGRVEKKEKSEKKKHKEGEYKDPVVLDVDKRHVESQKKRKRKEEKKDRKELEMRNKKMKENEEEEQNDVVDGNDETDAIEANDQDKKKKKEKKKEKKTKDGILTVDKEQKKIAKEKKKKTAIANHSGTVPETVDGRQNAGEKKQLDTDGVAGKAKKKKKDNVENKEEDNQEKKKKKKEKEKTTTAVDSSDPVKPKSKKVTFSDKLKVFPPSDDGSMKKGGDGYVRGKRFTPEEDEAIKNAIYEYIEERKLGEKGVEMILNCSKHKELRDCWHEIRKALPYRPYESIYLRAHTLFERDSVRRWSKEELDLVRQYHEKHGSNWALMAKEMGKFRHHVKEAWRRNRLENRNKGHWSQQEYQTMFELVNKDLQMKVLEEKKKRHSMLRDNIGWEAISTKMETRATAVCCRKWYCQLTSPMVAQGIWDDADDYRLLMALVDLDASCEDEVDWDCLLEHRSGDVCRARWNQMWNHLGEHGNKSWSEQVDVLSKRYCPDLLEVREQVDKQREWVNL